MDPKEAEEYVRGRWDDDSVTIDHNLDEPVVIGKDGGQRFFVDMIAAASFTLQREEEIRQKRVQIRWVRDAEIPEWSSVIFPDGTKDSILTILEAQLAALLVGWNEEP